jgi:hypothetical protein
MASLPAGQTIATATALAKAAATEAASLQAEPKAMRPEMATPALARAMARAMGSVEPRLAAQATTERRQGAGWRRQIRGSACRWWRIHFVPAATSSLASKQQRKRPAKARQQARHPCPRKRAFQQIPSTPS